MDPARRQSNIKRNGRWGFTLVELLVVIAIIGILAALITAAGAGALKRARQAQIKTELDQIAMAVQSSGAFPPNCQIDDITAGGGEPTATPLDEAQVLADLKYHMKKAFPRSREPDGLVAALAGLTITGGTATVLPGGMSAGEAVVFWLGGFSSDPKYPISGEGGPSYRIDSGLPSGVTAAQADPIESRKWIFPFEVARLQPRDADNHFDGRFIEYQVNLNGEPQTRRVNFWQYVPSKSEQPYLYFDTSRHPPTMAFDPPAATTLSGDIALHVHAIKRRSESAAASVPIQFANQDKFQLIHAGVDGEWGDEAFEQMSGHGVQENAGDPNDPDDYLLFPDGPFTGEVADTLVNFSEGTLEDSQP